MTLFLVLLVSQIPAQPDGGILTSSTVVINEFMALPLNSFTERDGEWIELYNCTDDWINLSGWVISNNYGQEVILSTYLLPPDGYFVMAACGDESLNGGLTPSQVYGEFDIEENGTISLYNTSRNLVDRISYDSTWPIAAGTSCERINPGWASDEASSWDYCTTPYGQGDLGTPCGKNSVYENSFTQNSWAFIKAFVQ